MKKWIIACTATACIVFFLAVILPNLPERAVDGENIRLNEVYSHELGAGIRIGMPKSQVEKLLGRGMETKAYLLYTSSYIYCGGSIRVEYEGNKAGEITVYDELFVTIGNLAAGDDEDDIPLPYVKASTDMIDGKVLRYYVSGVTKQEVRKYDWASQPFSAIVYVVDERVDKIVIGSHMELNQFSQYS